MKRDLRFFLGLSLLRQMLAPGWAEPSWACGDFDLFLIPKAHGFGWARLQLQRDGGPALLHRTVCEPAHLRLGPQLPHPAASWGDRKGPALLCAVANPALTHAEPACSIFMWSIPQCKIQLWPYWNDQLSAVSKHSFSWSNHVEYEAGLSRSTSYQLFQSIAWAGQTMLSMELVWLGHPATSSFKI